MSGFTAARTPVHRGPAGWNAILGERPANPALDGRITADFVVVGAGFAGLSAARRLRQLQPQARVVVLEAGSLAQSACGRNSGFMIDLPHDLASEDYAGAGDDRSMISLNRHAIAFARDAVVEYGIVPNFFDAAGKINGAASAKAEAHNVSYREHLAALGEPSELLDARQMREVTGSAHYRSGLFTSGTVMLQPAGYIRGLADGLSRSGVTVLENSAVLSIEQEGTGWRVSATGGSVSTPRVILAVNGHLESFGVERGRLLQLFLFAVMTPELDAGQIKAAGGAPRWGITPSDPMGTTVRRIDSGQGGNRIVTRTCAVVRPGCAATQGDLQRAERVMQRKFDKRFPVLAGLKMQYAWAGHLCLSLNGVAVMREIADGVYSACVQNGLGTTRGTLTGIGAADLACGQTSVVTEHFTKEARPRKLPPAPVSHLGANAVLRYREWLARDE